MNEWTSDCLCVCVRSIHSLSLSIRNMYGCEAYSGYNCSGSIRKMDGILQNTKYSVLCCAFGSGTKQKHRNILDGGSLHMRCIYRHTYIKIYTRICFPIPFYMPIICVLKHIFLHLYIVAVVAFSFDLIFSSFNYIFRLRCLNFTSVECSSEWNTNEKKEKSYRDWCSNTEYDYGTENDQFNTEIE